MGEDKTAEGRVLTDQALVSDQAAERLDPTGFDPSRIAEALEAKDGFWRSCTGCHETEDGYDVGHYSFSPVFKCKVGGGCGECGGLGVVWDSTDYEDMAKWSMEQDRIEASRREELRKLADAIGHIISNNLKFRQTGREPKLNAYHYAEIPDWMLRQWLRRLTNLDRSLAQGDVVRDSDASSSEDPKGLSGEAVAVRAEGIAQ